MSREPAHSRLRRDIYAARADGVLVRHVASEAGCTTTWLNAILHGRKSSGEVSLATVRAALERCIQARRGSR